MKNFLLELLPIWFTKKVIPDYVRPDKENALASLIRSIVFIIIFGYFFVRAYLVPTGSMKGTINENDFLLANRFIYGVKTPDQIGIPLTDIYFVREIPTIRLTPQLRDINVNDVLVFRADHEEPPVEYVKRLVAGPGDSLRNDDGNLFTNGEKLSVAEDAILDTQGNLPKQFESQNRNRALLLSRTIVSGGGYSEGIAFTKDFPYQKSTEEIINQIIDKSLEFTLTVKLDLQNKNVYNELYNQIESIKKMRSSGRSIELSATSYEDALFDALKSYFSSRMYASIKNIDHFSNIYIPKEGDVLDLSKEHSDMISNVVFYDGHTLDYRDSTYYIDGKEATSYTVEQDYYFFIGDNRHGSLDSRHWGMIPHKYIIGTPILKYFSINEKFWNSPRRKNANFFKKFIDLLFNLDEAINWDQIGKLVL